MGTTKYLEVNPTEGLTAHKEFLEAGEMIEPEVSVPMATADRPMEADTPEPEEEPEGSCICSISQYTHSVNRANFCTYGIVGTGRLTRTSGPTVGSIGGTV